MYIQVDCWIGNLGKVCAEGCPLEMGLPMSAIAQFTSKMSSSNASCSRP